MTDLGPIAIVSQSDRTDKITRPLDTTDVVYDVDPQSFAGYEFVIVETPDREMLEHVLKNPFRDSKLLFRMRGDPYWGIHHWYNDNIVGGIKKKVALNMLKHVNGCVAIAEHQAAKYREKTKVPTRIAQLGIDVDEWPKRHHFDDKLRAITLTNLMYPTKLDAILEYAGVVDAFLEKTGGEWRIGGKGRYEDRLKSGIAAYDNIEFCGYVDAKKALCRANVMLHFSWFDSFANAILEGMASRLPVVTTDHPAFTDADIRVNVIQNDAELEGQLSKLSSATVREKIGAENVRHVEQRFSYERIGQEWLAALYWFKSKEYYNK